jgi:hypothetical protein
MQHLKDGILLGIGIGLGMQAVIIVSQVALQLVALHLH